MEQKLDNWIPLNIIKPPNGEIVMTKIDNPDRNIQALKRRDNLWFVPDGGMYVYYEPTHWRRL